MHSNKNYCLDILIVPFFIKITSFHHFLIFFYLIVQFFSFNLNYDLPYIIIRSMILFSPNSLHYCNWGTVYLRLYLCFVSWCKYRKKTNTQKQHETSFKCVCSWSYNTKLHQYVAAATQSHGKVFSLQHRNFPFN